MSKFTPGPWIIDGGTNEKGDLYIWKLGHYFGGHAIATVHGEIEDNTTANARLIAQSPQMVFVLKCALADLWGWAMDNDLDLKSHEPTCQSIRQIIQVLTDAGIDVSDYKID